MTLVGKPWRVGDDEKLFWIAAQFDGAPFEFDHLALLSTGRTLRAKGVQATPDGNVKFQFKGIAEKALLPGLKLYNAAWPVRHEKKLYGIPLGAQNQKWNPGPARLRGSLLPPEGVEVDVKRIEAAEGKDIVVLTTMGALPALVGAVYTLEPKEGAPFDFALLTAGLLAPRDLADYIKKAYKFPGLPTVNALYSIGLRVHGSVVLPPPLWGEEFQETVGKDAVRFMDKAWVQFTKRARNAAAQPGGIAEDELRRSLALPAPTLDFLLEKMAVNGELRKVKEYWLPNADPLSYLSPLAKKTLESLNASAVAGIDLSSGLSPVLSRTYQALTRMGLAVETETPWIYGLSGWDEIRTKLCGPGTLAREWKIAEVKELLDVSRKPLLGILNRLEEEGWLERREDCRVVIKEAPAALSLRGQ